MGKIVDQQPKNGVLRRSANQCPNCGASLLMFGCDNPRCVNHHGNKRFFYHETIKTQAEIDEEFENKKKCTLIEPLSEFAKFLGKELDRYDLEDNQVNSVECTEDNLVNLYNSQFSDKTTYGEVYRYIAYCE